MKNEEQDLENPFVNHEKLDEEHQRLMELLEDEFSSLTLPALRLLLRRCIQDLAKRQKALEDGEDLEAGYLPPIERPPGEELSYIQ